MPYIDYERLKKWARERSRRVSKAGRDIGTIPPIRDIARRIESANSLLKYLQNYFPTKFYAKFSDNHLRFIEAVEQKICHGGNVAIGMPRGSGKSAIEKGAVHWAVANSHRRYVVVVAASKDEAVNFLDDIKLMFLSPIFAEDYPEIAYPLQQCDMSGRTTAGQTYQGVGTLITIDRHKLKLPTIPASPSSGNVILCTGINGRIRGKAEGLVTGETLRPSLVILDDLQCDDDAANPKRVEKLERKVKKTIKGLAGTGENMAMIMSATVIERDDLADRFLTPEIYPTWQSLRFKMVEKFPDDMKIWLNEYAPLFYENPKKANAFYRRNRSRMDAGATVDWKERYDRDTVSSRLEYAMRLYIEDRESFFSECQNEPTSMVKTALYVDAATVRKKVNTYQRGTIPKTATAITAMIDVHDDLLYYAVCAWEQDFTGYLIDYGTFPEQHRKFFAKNDASNIKLQDYYTGAKRLGAIRQGVTQLLDTLTKTEYKYDNDEHKTKLIDRVLIDARYEYQVIETAIKQLRNATIMPSIGIGIGATKRPMAEFPDRLGERKGKHWLISPMTSRRLQTLKIDTNFWKSDLHDSLALDVGDKGSFTLYSETADNHRLISIHISSETVKMVEANGNKVYEWQETPGQDNHYFDCVVGSMAAASTLGISRNYDAPKTTRRKRAF